MGPYKYIGYVVMYYRLRAGLTQKELAERAGCDQADICKIEFGYCNLTIKKLTKIANSMGKELLVDFVDPKTDS